MFVNNVNKKKYIGKSSNLLDRLRKYNDTKFLKDNRPSRINSALLKFGPDKFSLHIMEHCCPDKLSEREQYYIDNMKPQYNIRKKVTKREKSDKTD